MKSPFYMFYQPPTQKVRYKQCPRCKRSETMSIRSARNCTFYAICEGGGSEHRLSDQELIQLCTSSTYTPSTVTPSTVTSSTYVDDNSSEITEQLADMTSERAAEYLQEQNAKLLEQDCFMQEKYIEMQQRNQRGVDSLMNLLNSRSQDAHERDDASICNFSVVMCTLLVLLIAVLIIRGFRPDPMANEVFYSPW